MMKLLLLFSVFCSCSLSSGVFSWSAPQTLSTPGVNASDSQIVMDPSGNATAIWLEGASLKASTKPFGGSWSALTTLSASASSSQLGVDENGNVIALWLEGGAVLSSDLPFGGSWSAPSTLSSTGASTPQLAVQTNGNAVAVWARSGFIESATKLFGGSWSSVTILSGADADFPHVSIGSNGTVVAIWHRVISSADAIASASATVGGAWGTETNLFQPISSMKNNYPKVVVDPSGDATAIWFRYSETATDFMNVLLLSSILPANSPAWTIFPTILSNSAGMRDPGTLPLKIVCDANGNIIAQWTFSSDGKAFNVESSVKQVGNTNWKIPAPLVILNPHAHVGDISISSLGNALVTHMYFDGVSAVIQATDSNIAGLVPLYWSIPVNISGGTNNGFPRVGVALVGDALYGSALWLHFDGTNTVLETSSGSRTLIAAPTDVAAVQSVTDFGVYQDYKNTISWTASTAPGVQSYVLYRNGILFATTLSDTLQFTDHNRGPIESVTYGVAAIDDRVSQSAVVNVVVP